MMASDRLTDAKLDEIAQLLHDLQSDNWDKLTCPKCGKQTDPFGAREEHGTVPDPGGISVLGNPPVRWCDWRPEFRFRPLLRAIPQLIAALRAERAACAAIAEKVESDAHARMERDGDGYEADDRGAAKAAGLIVREIQARAK